MLCGLITTICSNKANVPADLQSAGIEYKDLQSDCFILLFNRYELRITDPYISCCRIANPTEHYPCGLQATIRTNKTNVPADLQSAGIKYKDLQSDCFILLFNRYELRIEN